MASGSAEAAKPPPAVDFAAGTFAGVAGLFVGQPLDTIKVRFQSPQYSGRYTGTLSAFNAIIKEEKVRGLFKGVTSPMAGIAFINGVVFSSYSFFMRVQGPATAQNGEPSLAQICLAGAGSGVVAAFLTTPTELVKIRQQSAPPHLNPTTIATIKTIVRDSGVFGLYRGFSATACRDLGYGPYFCTYEAVCRFLRSRKPIIEKDTPATTTPRPHHDTLIDEIEIERESLTWPELMTAGGFAGVTAWFVTFPIDVIKTRVQGHVGPGKPPSIWRVGYDACRTEGMSVLFSGLGPTMLRAIPTNMVIFLAFEACVAAMTP